MVRSFPISFVSILATTLGLVAGNKHHNCSVDTHCSPWKNFSAINFINKERHESSERNVQLSYTKDRPGEKTGFKRDNTFTEVLKNLLAKVDNTRRKFVGMNKPPQATVVTSPILKPVAKPVNASKTTPAPSNSGPSAVTTAPSASPTSGGTSITTPGSEASSSSPATVTNSPSPTPTTAVTVSANVSCNASSGSCPTVKPGVKPPPKPGKNNITIAPGVVITPSGEIILSPHLPLLMGAGQTSGGQSYPGISPGAGKPPGTVSIPSGMVTSGHPGVAAQQGRPVISQTLFSNVVIAR